jgi:DNA repair exonuclease SbcCD ATPase subunit
MSSTEAQLALLESKLNATANDVSDIKGVISSIDKSLQKLTLLEERHSQTRENSERAHKRIDEVEDLLQDEIKGHEKRIQSLELHDAKGLWVERVVWVAVAGIIAAIIKMGL